MSRWLRLALAAQVAFFVIWGGRLLASHRDADVVWLATEPVDPRDLLRGNYVALRYPIESPAVPNCAGVLAARPSIVYVRLAPARTPVATAEGPVAVFDAIDCRSEPPSAGGDERWIGGRFIPDRQGRIEYGIERFYVGETDTLRDARSGTVVAKVRINRDLQARIVGLVRLSASR